MATDTVVDPSVRTSKPTADRAFSQSHLYGEEHVATISGECNAADPIVAALSRLYAGSDQTSIAVASTDMDSSPATEANPSTPQPAGEQRSFPRRASAGFVSVVRYPAGADVTRQWTDWLMQTSGLTGELVDLSRSGLALVSLQSFAAGDALVVRLSQLDRNGTLDAVVEVVRSIDLGDQRWKIMARFTRPLGFEEAYEFACHDQDALSAHLAAT
jgi:PilZ domain